MSRNLKNIIMIVLVISLATSIYFTEDKIQKESFNITKGSNFLENDMKNIPDGDIGNPPDGDMKNDNAMENPPDKPEGTENNNQSGDKMQDNRNMRGDFAKHSEEIKIDNKYIILFGVENLFISLIIMYLIMSKLNKKNFKETFENGDKVTILILSLIILVVGLSVIEFYFVKKDNSIDRRLPNDMEKTQKETLAEDVESGKDVVEKNIDLSEYTSNITITDSGEYTITGKFEFSLLINSSEEVILNLDNVTIENEITAAIANTTTNPLTINLLENTVNTLSDGGSSEYDACIYSAGPLTISGVGKLEVYGNQEEGEGIATETNDITINGGNIYIESNDDGINAGGDGGKITINNGYIYIMASGDGIDSNKNLVINGGTVYTVGSPTGGDVGIDTDDGFDINGGLVIALGSGMLEKPNSTSSQKFLCSSLDNTIEKGTLITLMNENDEVIVSFEASENFSTLIISSNLLEEGTYYLYKDGENTGRLENGIYYDGEYTKGSEITVKNSNSFKIE